MALNPELLKLIGILGGGTLIFLVIFFIQRNHLKKKKQEMEEYSSSQFENDDQTQSSQDVSSISSAEQTAKNYIGQYKGQYPRESLKSGLMGAGNDEESVNKWLDKYL